MPPLSATSACTPAVRILAQPSQWVQLTQPWRNTLHALGAERIQLIAQNRYLAATGRQRGLCSALSAQLAAVWLQAQPGHSAAKDHPPAALVHYLERIQQAIEQPQLASAQLFELGLLEWSFNPSVAKFDAHPAQDGLGVAQIATQLERANTPSAFELVHEQHALVVAVSQAQGQRHYFLADPNYGAAEFSCAEAFTQALTHTLQPRIRARRRPLLSLRQYRSDLPSQALLPAAPGTSPLSLADLGRAPALAQRFNQNRPLQQNAFFRRLQQRLQQTEAYLSTQPQPPSIGCHSDHGWLCNWLERLPRQEVDRLYLGSALPEDGYLSDQIIEIMQRAADSTLRAPPSLPSPEQELSLTRCKADLRIAQTARQFEQSTAAMLANEAHPEQWIPIFASARAEADGGSSMAFHSRLDPEQTVRHSLPDSRALEMQQWVDLHFNAANNALDRRLPGEEIGSSNGLNSVFALQALARRFSADATTADPSIGKNLALALQIHDIANDIQIATGVVEDASKVGQLIKLGLQAEAEGSMLMGASSRLLGAVGGGIMLFSLGLDIYELTEANSDTQRAVFGNRLAFDSGGLALMAASMIGCASGTALGGAVASAAFPAGVLLAGLGIGTAALVDQFAAIAKSAGALGELVRALHDNRRAGGMHYDREKKQLSPLPWVVIAQLNLKDHSLRFGQAQIFASQRAGMSLPDVLDNGDQRTLIDLGAAWQLAEQARFAALSADDVVILPATPPYTINYQYQILLGATDRHDAGFKLLRALAHNQRFVFDGWSNALQFLACRPEIQNQVAKVQIILGPQAPRLQMPHFPEPLKYHLTYQLQADGGIYHIGLQSGAALKLSTAEPSRTQWILDARALDSSRVEVEPSDNLVRLGGDQYGYGSVAVSVVEPQSTLLLLLNNGDVQNLTLASQRTPQTVEIDAARWPQAGADLTAHLRSLAATHLLGPHTLLVKNYQLPARDGQAAHTLDQAYYDVAGQRMLYVHDQQNYRHTSLALLAGDQVFFYNHDREKVLRIDPANGKILATFAMINQHPKQALRLWQEQGVIYLSNASGDMVFRIVADQLILQRLNAQPALAPTLQQQTQINGAERLAAVLACGVAADARRAQAARLPHDEMVTIDLRSAGQLQQRYWLQPDGALISRWLAPTAKGKTPALPEDQTLAAILHQRDGQPVAYFYSATPPQLYRQEGWGPNVRQAHQLEIPNLSQVSRVDGQLYAGCTDGLIYRIDGDGVLMHSAVSRPWLQAQSPWWQKLTQLEGVGALSILDLAQANGRALPAWFQEGQVVLSATFQPASQAQAITQARPWSATVRLLGLDPDGQHAWLCQANDPRLYRQARLDAHALAQAFDHSSLTLRHSAALPPAEAYYHASTLEAIGRTLRLTVADKLPPLISGIDQWLLTPLPALKRLRIEQRHWAALQRIALDFSQLPSSAPSADRLQITLALDNPLALSASRDGDDLLLFDRASGKSLLLLQVFGAQGLPATVNIIQPDGQPLALETIRQALTAPDAEIWRMLLEPTMD